MRRPWAWWARWVAFWLLLAAAFTASVLLALAYAAHPPVS